jgi:dihydrofolate synthase/folylpolyglutamate synthase
VQLTYDQALAFWYGCINYEQRPPLPDDLKLEQMRALLTQLRNPQERLRIVHISGSKGKGSTAAMLAAILREAGYRTGLFTSPHLCDVGERIQIDGKPIGHSDLACWMTEIQAVVTRLRQHHVAGISDPSTFSPTFFEIATALGFYHFWLRRVDLAVVEVGLGGRLDSTNVCVPEVSIITSISFDHTRQLGNKLTSIAREKAGIVKPRRPVISGATVPEAREVIEQICRERQAPLRQLGNELHYQYFPGKVTTPASLPLLPHDHRTAPPPHHLATHHPSSVQITTDRRTWPTMELRLLGEHQAANAALVIGCVEELQVQGWNISDKAVKKGLGEVVWPARLEVISRHPLVVLDCAHNVASAQAMVEALDTSFPPGRRHLIFASSNDKDVRGILEVLGPCFSHVYATRYANNPRCVPPEELARLVADLGPTPVTVCSQAIDAWKRACEHARPDDLICITGSVFLAGELRPVITSGL